MYLPNLSAMGRTLHRINFQAGLNLEFSFLTGHLTKAEEPSLSKWGRREGFIFFPRALAQSEKLTAPIQDFNLGH